MGSVIFVGLSGGGESGLFKRGVLRFTFVSGKVAAEGPEGLKELCLRETREG